MEIVGIYIEDIIRVCKGGKPAAQLEIGCQKGGNYFCFNCKLNSLYFENIFHSFSLYHISIQDRLDKIFCSNSTVNRMKTRNTHYFTELHKADIISELHQRSVKFLVSQDLYHLKISRWEIQLVTEKAFSLYANTFKKITQITLLL